VLSRAQRPAPPGVLGPPRRAGRRAIWYCVLSRRASKLPDGPPRVRTWRRRPWWLLGTSGWRARARAAFRRRPPPGYIVWIALLLAW